MKFSNSPLFLGLTVSTLVNGILAFKPPQVFENSKFVRSFDLTGSYVKESIAIEVKNIGDKPESVYYYAVPQGQAESIAVIEGREDKGRVAAVNLDLIEEGDDETGASFYKVELSSPLKPEETTTLQLGVAYTNRYVPTPEFGTQFDSQLFVFEDSCYAFSAYPSAEQVLNIGTYGLQISDLSSNEDPTIEGTTLKYGPFEDVAPYASEELQIKFENPKPLLKATKLQRDIWISHWGSTASFEEFYQMHNPGTKLKDNSFSRLDYARRTNSYNLNVAATRNIDIKLPPYAREPYYTDLVGNVSTSNFRQESTGSLLQLRSRYPIFGGWNYNFTIGWNVDLKFFSRVVGEDRYLLKLPLLEGPEDISYDEVVINIILPEGSQDIDLSAMTPSVPETIKVVKSYLDFFGRPTIQLRYDNVIDNYRRSEIFVSYTFTKQDALKKPAIISAVFVCFFSVFLFLAKIDIGITPKKK